MTEKLFNQLEVPLYICDEIVVAEFKKKIVWECLMTKDLKEWKLGHIKSWSAIFTRFFNMWETGFLFP